MKKVATKKKKKMAGKGRKKGFIPYEDDFSKPCSR
jgi:hypothetical protein